MSLKEIAEKVGVSYSTVSYALSNDSRVSASTREKVLSVAKELNYAPNNFGRALQSNKSHLVGFMLQNVTGSFFSEILQGVATEACSNNYGLLTAIAHVPEIIDEQIKIFREKRVDGVILSGYSSFLYDKIEFLEKMGLPVVLASFKTKQAEFPYVTTDDFQGAFMATEHLISLGHRRIAYGFKNNDNDSMNKRYDGVKEALKKHSLPKQRCFCSENELYELLKRVDRPTGIVSYSDIDAINVINIADSLAIDIPHDLSVTGFDDISIASLSRYNLTTVAQAKIEIGKRAMKMLLSRIAGNDVDSIILCPRLIIRGSTSPSG